MRAVDITELLARLLRGYVDDKVGYLFATKNESPLQQRNGLRALRAAGKEVGFHAFHLFRTQTLRRGRLPEDLTRLWLGHAD